MNTNLSDVANIAVNTNSSFAPEPSIVANDQIIFETANWYASVSTDAGASFQYIAPGSLGPVVNGGFCCDQRTLYDPAHNLIFWMVMMNPDAAGNNTLRLGVIEGFLKSPNSSVPIMVSYYYDFTPQAAGNPSGVWYDYPDLAIDANNLFITENVFVGGDPNNGMKGARGEASEILRLPLAALAAGTTLTYNKFTDFQADTYKPADGLESGLIAVTHPYAQSVRVVEWLDQDASVSVHDVGVALYQSTRGYNSCPDPTGGNWCGYADERVLAAWINRVGSGYLGVMWNCGQTSVWPRPFPYVRFSRFNPVNFSLIDETDIMNPAFAYQYPSVGVNTRGDWAGTIAWGGGGYFPSSALMIDDDVTGYSIQIPYNLVLGDSDPGGRWGDYFTTRPHSRWPNSWVTVATGETMVGHPAFSGGSEEHMVWFGRNRDLPPYPLNGSCVDPGVIPGLSDVLVDINDDNSYAVFLPLPAPAEATLCVPTERPLWYEFSAPLDGMLSVYSESLAADGVVAIWDATTCQQIGISPNACAGADNFYLTLKDVPVLQGHEYQVMVGLDQDSSIVEIGRSFSFQVRLSGKPVVTRVIPGRGSVAGGTKVTVFGNGFDATTTVSLGGHNVFPSSVLSPTELHFVTPAHVAGGVDVAISKGDGQTTVARDAFQYLAYPACSRSMSRSGTVGTGNGPQAVVLADLNLDGALDAVTGNLTSDSLSVLLGSGVGGFRPAVSESAGQLPTGIAVADFNNDGFPDLAVTNPTAGTITMLMGDGTGNFPTTTTIVVGGSPSAIVGVDFDGDGRPDLTFTDTSSGKVFVMSGNGDGSFRPPDGYSVGNMPAAISTADLRGRGLRDIVVVNYGDGTISVLSNGAFGPTEFMYPGVFTVTSTPVVGSQPDSVAIGDLNGDGIPDLVVGKQSGGGVSVLFGNGDGTFKSSNDVSLGAEISSVSLVDLSNDGHLDLVAADLWNNTVYVLRGNGNGTFAPPVSMRTNSPGGVDVGDLNGDGATDVVVTDGMDNMLVTFLNGCTTLAAEFVFAPTNPLSGQSVQFTDTSTGSPSSWSWTFGDGSNSSTRNPKHTFSTAGADTVTLTVSNGQTSNSTSQRIIVGNAGQKSVTATVDGRSGPWQVESGPIDYINTPFVYGIGDDLAPVVVSTGLDFTPGTRLTITYVSGTVSVAPQYPLPFVDANGMITNPVNNTTGNSGKVFPSYYMNPATYPINIGELVGTFADAHGEIVGTPFAVGDGPTSVTVPSGATQLQLGVNDTIYNDNKGSFTVVVSVQPNPCPSSGPCVGGVNPPNPVPVGGRGH